MANPLTLLQLSSSLTSLSLPTPTAAFLSPILNSPTSSTTRPPPLAALTATAKHRLLSASISSSPSILVPITPSFPSNISDVSIQNRVLGSDVFVQVLDIEDLGHSKWEQIEALESERKGETTKGREVIRVVPAEPNAEPSSAATQNLAPSTANAIIAAGKGPFKLLLQDWKGKTVYGFELQKLERVGMPPKMGIGAKMLLKRETKVARGVVMLEPGSVIVFGGRITALDKVWREGREERLRKEVERRVEE